jgi:hypothetical protein
MNLDSYIRLLQSADAQIDHDAARLLTEATDDLRDYAQSIGHKQSGNMVGSMHRLGPFPQGAGVLEARVESGAWYAGEEAAKGGTHDWPSRTIAEQQARILQLELELGNAVVAALTGARSG